jgi:hypothetical protein
MPNMPMQPKYSTSFQVAGIGMPSQTIAWISTHMPAIDATDAGQRLDVVAAVLASGP